MGAWVYSVNVPGYLPKSDPVTFSDLREALDYAADVTDDHDLGFVVAMVWDADADADE